MTLPLYGLDHSSNTLTTMLLSQMNVIFHHSAHCWSPLLLLPLLLPNANGAGTAQLGTAAFNKQLVFL